MKRCIFSLSFIVLLAICYAEEKTETNQVKTAENNRYVLAFQSGFKFYGVSIAGSTSPLYSGAFAGSFMYLMPSGFTISTDAEAIIGSGPFLGFTGGVGLNFFLGYSWFFPENHTLTLSAGVENSFTSKFISVFGGTIRLSYIYKFTDKIGSLVSGTFGMFYNGINAEGSFVGITNYSTAIKAGVSYDL